ncbi:NYN domain-containing protein [Microcoleus sp. FACHB-1515]|uniref:NYN domain-containing protein n=1 Tax=Cyanophyceae TaxID=3028117 RepID=UPI00168425DF|nr:NYN domain-containing protein [Microcoleus sp. FACHB-1515]MBD2089262.1 NYN domain-containing protein [Microcoleus sp. FACHB-1515]
MSNKGQFNSARLAVLIDADNANPDLIEPLLKEVATYGIAHVKRIYGDWTTPQLGKWKENLNKYAIQPIQQFGYTKGKNATDSAMIIDAMDLLYTQNFDGFCIVSSDSDFTRLASRIRESGLIVYGFGDKEKTPQAFISACDKFIYTEILERPDSISKTQLPSSNAKEGGLKESLEPKNGQKTKENQELIRLLKDAYEASPAEDGWANLGLLGHNLQKISPSFDSRNYGYKRLGLANLVRAVEIFEVKDTSKGTQIRLKT